MLSNLFIKNLALVEELDIEFSPGLNVVTGETGAGKSIILGAVKLLLGERADKSLIRTDTQAAEISAVLELGDSPLLKNMAEEILNHAGIIPDDSGQVILRRIITSKSSKNFINSTPTTLQTMKDLGSCFIDIYAPGEQQGLADNSKQRLLLDRYAGLKTEVEKTAKIYSQLNKLRREKDNFHQHIPDRGELEILRYQLDEIKKADLKENEDEQVQKEYNICAGARELIESARTAAEHINGEESAITQLQQAVRLLQSMKMIDKENTSPLLTRVDNLVEELFDVSRDIDDYASSLNVDPENLDYLEERMKIIQQLKRKFGPELENVFAYRQKLEDKIARADSSEDEYNELFKKITSCEEEFKKACKTLTGKRTASTPKLSKGISAELAKLGFKGSRFDIDISPASPGPSGCDHVEFCFAPNEGEGSKPIKDIASSGEISRVMLAVKTVLAKIDKVPILIFDEIDANIGGVVATQVADKLVDLGKHHQIFCITHMPQVAAGGITHFRVEKNLKAGRTVTEMVLLEKEHRVEEIARMLGGSEISSVVKKHAEELLGSR